MYAKIELAAALLAMICLASAFGLPFALAHSTHPWGRVVGEVEEPVSSVRASGAMQGLVSEIDSTPLRLVPALGWAFGPIPAGSLFEFDIQFVSPANGTPVDGVPVEAWTSLGDTFTTSRDTMTVFNGTVGLSFYAVNVLGPVSDEIFAQAQYAGRTWDAAQNITIEVEPFDYSLVADVHHEPVSNATVTSGETFDLQVFVEYHERPINGTYIVLANATGAILGEGLTSVGLQPNLTISVTSPVVWTPEAVNLTLSAYELGTLISQAGFSISDSPQKLNLTNLLPYLESNWQALGTVAFGVVAVLAAVQVFPSRRRSSLVYAVHAWPRGLAVSQFGREDGAELLGQIICIWNASGTIRLGSEVVAEVRLRLVSGSSCRYRLVEVSGKRGNSGGPSLPRSGWLPIALPFDYWLPRRGVVLAGDSDREPQPNFELDGVMVPGGPPRQVRWLRPEAAVFLWLLPLGGYITLWLAAGATLLSSLPIGPQSTLYYVAILGALSALFTWLTLRAVELWPVLPRISELRLVA